ncbi:MAG TPA: orotidine-5'-phosphate decarboxylase [Pyrinomonadaceae bacterium]|nr:orotidine-5'-phosphate decarboxylase [Pyrinomonadaceae bacterium]
MNLTPRERLIVALDVDSAQRARALVRDLNQLAGMFKIGSHLFTAAGPEIVREIVRSGSQVFLDLKFHDIPNTVASAAAAATRLGVRMLNLHAAGGAEMMRRTRGAVSEAADEERIPRPWVIAVTVLTSADAVALKEVGVPSPPEAQVTVLAKLAAANGMDGVVASPREVALIRSNVSLPEFLIITPGIRPSDSPLGDQKRVMNPAGALKIGADFIVVGRPITEAPDPAEAARLIIDEMEKAAPGGRLNE